MPKFNKHGSAATSSTLAANRKNQRQVLSPTFWPRVSWFSIVYGAPEIYRKKVENLTNALNEKRTRAEASAAIRRLVQEIRLIPDGEDRLNIELCGELASLISLGANKAPQDKVAGVQVTLVAGAGSLEAS